MSEKIRNLIADEKLLVTYFSYPGCNVCKVLLPRVEELIGGFPEITFQYINTEVAQDIAGQHLVFAVPTIIFFSEGKEINRFSRFISIEELEMYLERIRQA